MRAAELAETALSMKNVSSDAEGTWTAFEVIENGELGEQEAESWLWSHWMTEMLFSSRG